MLSLQWYIGTQTISSTFRSLLNCKYAVLYRIHLKIFYHHRDGNPAENGILSGTVVYECLENYAQNVLLTFSLLRWPQLHCVYIILLNNNDSVDMLNTFTWTRGLVSISKRSRSNQPPLDIPPFLVFRSELEMPRIHRTIIHVPLKPGTVVTVSFVNFQLVASVTQLFVFCVISVTVTLQLPNLNMHCGLSLIVILIHAWMSYYLNRWAFVQ